MEHSREDSGIPVKQGTRACAVEWDKDKVHFSVEHGIKTWLNETLMKFPSNRMTAFAQRLNTLYPSELFRCHFLAWSNCFRFEMDLSSLQRTPHWWRNNLCCGCISIINQALGPLNITAWVRNWLFNLASAIPRQFQRNWKTTYVLVPCHPVPTSISPFSILFLHRGKREKGGCH